MGWKTNNISGMQADGQGGGKYHRFLKKSKLRRERRRAKQNPECIATYRKYCGYET